tara:strand:+ start:38018 stop:43003 length:4986 start_codon:yes stop_codon:yes gene_type:complete
MIKQPNETLIGKRPVGIVPQEEEDLASVLAPEESTEQPDNSKLEASFGTQGNPDLSAVVAQPKTLKDVIGKRESSNDYKAVNQLGYAGKYQFGKLALIDAGYKDMEGNWTGKNDVKSQDDWLNNSIAQEDGMDTLMSRNLQSLTNRGLSEFLGQTINGVLITEQGAAMSAHLIGAKGTMDMIKSGISATDANGVSGFDYIKTANEQLGLTNQGTTNFGVPLKKVSSGIYDSKLPEGGATGLTTYNNPLYMSYREQALLEGKNKEEYDKVSDSARFMNAAKNEFVFYSAERWLERQGRGVVPTKDFAIDDATQEELIRNYKDDERVYLNEAVSEQDLKFKMADIEEDRKRNQLAAEGGFGWTLSAAILDPAAIVLSFATAPLTATVKASRLVNAMRTAGVVSAESMAIEYALIQGDTQKDWKDMYIAGMAGGVFGSVFGAARRTAISHAGGDELNEIIKKESSRKQYNIEKEKLTAIEVESGSFKAVLNDVQRSLTDLAQKAEGVVFVPRVIHKINKTIDKTKLRMEKLKVSRQEELEAITDSVNNANPKNILNRSQKKAIDKDFKILEKEKAVLIEARDTEVRDFWAKRGVAPNEMLDGVTRDQARRITKKYDDQIVKLDEQLEVHTKARRKSSVASKASKANSTKNPELIAKRASEAMEEVTARYDADITSLDSQVNRYQSKLNDNDTLITDKAELDKVKKMSEEEQVSHFSNMSVEKAADALTIVKRLKETFKELLPEDSVIYNKYKPAEPEAEGGAKSGGAAVNIDQVSRLFPEAELADMDEAIMDAAIARYVAFEDRHGKNWTKFIPTIMQSTYSIVNKSDDMGILSLNHLLLDNPQLGDAHTVATLAQLNDLRIRRAGHNAIDRGFEQYLSEQGINSVKGHVDVTHRRKFEKSVSLAVKGIGDESNISDSIKLARDGVRNQLKQAGELRKLNRERGFEDLTSNANYLPDVMDSSAVSRLNDQGWTKDNIIDLISKGYENGGAELTKRQSRAIAYIKYDSISQQWLSSEDAFNVFRADRVTDAQKILKDANVPQDLVDDFFKDVFAKEDWASISKRARKSLFIDWDSSITVKGKKTKVADIMNTNVSQLTEAYTIDSSFGSALAELGIKSEGQLNRIMDTVEKQAVKTGVDKGQIKAHMKLLKDSITLLKGRPLIDYSKDVNKAGRVALDITAQLRLQQVGFASIPEFARIMSEIGIAETFKAVKASGMLRMPTFGKAGKGAVAGRDADMKLFQEEMESIEEMIGFVGEAEFNRTWNVREDDLGSEMSGSFMQGLDSVLEGGRRIGSYVSGHQTIQGGLAKVSALGTSRKLLKALNGTTELPKSLKNQLRMTGMSDERFDEIADFIKANGKTTSFKGRAIPVWNSDAMRKIDNEAIAVRESLILTSADLADEVKVLRATRNKVQARKAPDAEELNAAEDALFFKKQKLTDMQIDIDKPVPSIERDIQVTLQRLLNRSVLKGGVGEMNNAWLGSFGRFLTQFRTFSLNSLEKQLVADVRGDVASMPSKFMLGTGLAGAAYMAQMNLRALGMPEEERSAYLEKTTSGANMAWGVFNKHSQLAAAGVVSDAMVLSGMMPKEFYDGTRYGYMNSNIDSFVPALGMANDALQAVSAMTGLVGSITPIGDKDTDEALKKFKKDILDVTPFANTIGFGEYFKNL